MISPPWMVWMRSHIGEPEITGSLATAFERLCFSHTNFGQITTEPAGCAATACAALEETGYSSPHSAAADSFMGWGTVSELVPGCIVIFKWPKGDYHVTFCDEVYDEASVRCLGGNQSGSLCYKIYPQAYIVGTRWPKQAQT